MTNYRWNFPTTRPTPTHVVFLNVLIQLDLYPPFSSVTHRTRDGKRIDLVVTVDPHELENL